MRYRRLGKTGLAVSVVGLGCNNFGRRIDFEETRRVVDAAIDEGITLFDTADRYTPSEEFLGRILGSKRDDIVLATKFGMDMRGANGQDWDARGSRRYIRRAVEASLRLLQTDWIDLYQLHRPDPLTPIEETLSVLTDLVHEGKVRYIGSSELTAWEIADSDWIARTSHLERFISAENEYNLIDRDLEADVQSACERYEIGILPYSPLANGLLSGKYRRGQEPPAGSRIDAWQMSSYLTDHRFDAIEALERFASERSIELIDVAIGGLAAQPCVSSVIAGATSAEQVHRNAKAGDWIPSLDDLALLDQASPTKRPVEKQPYTTLFNQKS